MALLYGKDVCRKCSPLNVFLIPVMVCTLVELANGSKLTNWKKILQKFQRKQCCKIFDITKFSSLQSLQNKSYNHFAAIYYLLVERLKAHRSSFPVEQRLNGAQRRPSIVADQTVLKVFLDVIQVVKLLSFVCAHI